LDSTREIVEKLLSDEVPTVVYVAPSGGGAASAGTFITLAADVAAMAPNTTIGAAHPVSFGVSPRRRLTILWAGNWRITLSAISRQSRAGDIIMLTGPSPPCAIASQRNAQEALKLNVIDLIAPNVTNLLDQLDGRQVNGKHLRTAHATLVEMPMSARERVFQVLWRPEVMFLLMLVAMYGIIGELSSPEPSCPASLAPVALILALYMVQSCRSTLRRGAHRPGSRPFCD